jgi:hypothetical protein
MAAGMLFIVCNQRKAGATVSQVLLFETIKAVLATAWWLWFILDCAFGPWRHRRHFGPHWDASQEEVKMKVQRAGLLVFMLM